MSKLVFSEPRLQEAATERLVAEVRAIRANESRTAFENRQRIARLLGANYHPDSGLTQFGFWAPELTAHRVADREVALELFTPLEPIDFSAERLALTFARRRISLHSEGDYWWGVVEGVRAGTATEAGSFYWLHANDPAGDHIVIRDLLAYSLPYGSFAPAEVYDVVSLDRNRRDRDHFARPAGVPGAILELHIPTATREGTVAALAETYRRIGEKLAHTIELLPDEMVYAGYDAIQPLPVDPTIERPRETPSFAVTDVVDEIDGIVGVLLLHPENQNWGYDNIVASSSATNPSLLASRRPDEMVALAEALHALPEPMMLIYDIVYGHADNQAAEVLPRRFFKGPNMYGMDLNHQDPTVRAILLEMQRRRMNSGCDGLRVDGAQDFKFYDPRTGEVEYDDDFLQSMSDVEQCVGGHTRRVWMIFEDGRPWPAEGWETRSTYRDVIDKQPETFQWGPLIFAHNTPMLDGFWSDKWWRVEQVLAMGGNWISGCANHDTVRRGTQVDPKLPLNRYLGDDLPAILDRAYDNPALMLMSYGLFPGIPMDFINATTRSPWAFMRTTDDLYGVKVMAEEAGFLQWQVRDDTFDDPRVFRRTKRHGFESRRHLYDFLTRLAELAESSEYDLDSMVLGVDSPAGLRPGREGLLLLAYDYMRDVHELCNVSTGLAALDSELVTFAFRMREFRRQHIWLRDSCRASDQVEKIDAEQVRYQGWRVSPDGERRVAAMANMAGATWTGSRRMSLPMMPESVDTMRCIISPGARAAGDELILPDGTGVLYTW